PAGSNTVNVPIATVGAGSTNIRAGALPDIATALCGVTVTGTISLPASATVGLGKSTAFPVTLSVPAPAGGVVVTLTSSNTGNVTVTASVTIAAGATTAATPPQITGVNFGLSTITASAPGYVSASQPVGVNATMSFTQSAITIIGTATQNLTLQL